MPCKTTARKRGVVRERLCNGSSSMQAVKGTNHQKRSEADRIRESERLSIVLYTITYSSNDLRRSLASMDINMPVSR